MYIEFCGVAILAFALGYVFGVAIGYKQKSDPPKKRNRPDRSPAIIIALIQAGGQ